MHLSGDTGEAREEKKNGEKKNRGKVEEKIGKSIKKMWKARLRKQRLDHPFSWSINRKGKVSSGRNIYRLQYLSNSILQ